MTFKVPDDQRCPGCDHYKGHEGSALTCEPLTYDQVSALAPRRPRVLGRWQRLVVLVMLVRPAGCADQPRARPRRTRPASTGRAATHPAREDDTMSAMTKQISADTERLLRRVAERADVPYDEVVDVEAFTEFGGKVTVTIRRTPVTLELTSAEMFALQQP